MGFYRPTQSQLFSRFAGACRLAALSDFKKCSSWWVNSAVLFSTQINVTRGIEQIHRQAREHNKTHHNFPHVGAPIKEPSPNLARALD